MIKIDSLPLSKAYCNGGIKKAVLNGSVLYESAPQLATPQNLSVTDTTASFDEVENAESYEFFVDDVSIGEYPSLIEFDIYWAATSHLYSATDGMTWAQWCDSAYNTDGYYVDDGSVYQNATKQVAYQGSLVSASDTIVNGRQYKVQSGG